MHFRLFARRERLQAQLDQIDDTGTVVVVPMLESFEAADFAQAAGEGDIAAVREMVKAEQLTLFHSQNFRAGHGATDIEEWLRDTPTAAAAASDGDAGGDGGGGGSRPYEICYEPGFEPFAVMHTDLASSLSAAAAAQHQVTDDDGDESPSPSSPPPLFETTFRHPHKDKCAVYLRASYSATKFIVLRDVCLFAPPHTPSTLRRGENAPDGDLFAQAAGEARFAAYNEELTRYFGTGTAGEEDDGDDDESGGSRAGGLKGADARMLVQETVWRGDAESAAAEASGDDESGAGLPPPRGPFWLGWQLSGGVDTLGNVAVQTNDGTAPFFRVSFPGDGQMGLQTKLLLPAKRCDQEAGLACDVYFPRCFPVADGRGGKLPGLSIGDGVVQDVLSCCFRWTADGRLCFGVVAATPSLVQWSRERVTRDRESAFRGGRGTRAPPAPPQTAEHFDRHAAKFLWSAQSQIPPDNWTSLRQELMVGTKEGTVEVRAAVNGVVIADAVVWTRPEHMDEPGSIGTQSSLGDWEWPSPQTSLTFLVPPVAPGAAHTSGGGGGGQQRARIVTKLHAFAIFASSLSDHQSDADGKDDDDDDGKIGNETPWLGLRRLAVTGASCHIRTIMVIGFHHSGAEQTVL